MRGLGSPVITCSDLPTETGGEWQCDPPHYPGQAYHVNTACVLLCDGQALAVAYCNQFGSWMPENPEHFTCGVRVLPPARHQLNFSFYYSGVSDYNNIRDN